jgi:hypothetical protein
MNSMIRDQVSELSLKVSGRTSSQACSVEDGDEALVLVTGMVGGMGECGIWGGDCGGRAGTGTGTGPGTGYP